MTVGKELEHTVHALARAILGDNPIEPRTFKITPNVIVRPRGVRHEIDLHVIDEASGELYLFECKNTKRPVGKNAVIVLAEKARALKATRAFLVAPRFTEFSRRQARIGRRITLLESAKHVISPMTLQSFTAEVTQIRYAAVDAKGPVQLRLSAMATDGTTTVPLQELLNRFAQPFVNARICQPDVQRLPVGKHTVACSGNIAPPAGHSLSVDGVSVLNIAFEADVEVTLAIPAIRFGYDVATKHRFVKIEPGRISETQTFDGISLSGPR